MDVNTLRNVWEPVAAGNRAHGARRMNIGGREVTICPEDSDRDRIQNRLGVLFTLTVIRGDIPFTHDGVSEWLYENISK